MGNGQSKHIIVCAKKIYIFFIFIALFSFHYVTALSSTQVTRLILKLLTVLFPTSTNQFISNIKS